MVGPTRYVLPLAEQEATMVSDVGVTLFSEKSAVKTGWRRQAWSTGGTSRLTRDWSYSSQM